MASIELHPAVSGLRTTEVAGGYVLSETGDRAPARAMGRFLGFSFIVAGLGLMAVPVGAGFLAKAVIVAVLVATGGIFAARAGRAPRMELEVDLARRLLRKRRRVGRGAAHLVAQWSFDTISGLGVDGEGARAALFVEAGRHRRALISGAPEALREAALRIGTDLLRSRGAG